MNEADLMKAATEEVAYSNVYWGKCLLTLWEGKFPRNDEGKIVGKPVRWVEGDSPKERIIMIDFLLDLCPGCTANYQVKAGWMKHDKDWQKIVLPSLKEAGAVTPSGEVDLTQVKDHWVKVQQVEGTRPRDKNNPDKGCWNTYKFLQIFKNSEECQENMQLEMGGLPIPSETATATPKIGKNDQRRTAALEFCRVAIGTYKGMKTDEIKTAIANFIESNPNAKPYVKVDDPEIIEMINEASIPFD